jgi:hypothetical protein
VQAAERWVDAVKAEGSYGKWRYLVAGDVPSIPSALDSL